MKCGKLFRKTAAALLSAALAALCFVPARAAEPPGETPEALVRVLGVPVSLAAYAPGEGVVWTGPDPGTVRITAEGELIALKAGTAALTARGGDGAALVRLTVRVEPGEPGDADENGVCEAADARLALRRAVELETFAPDSFAFLACDADHDGAVTAADARAVLRAAVGLETPASPPHRHVFDTVARSEPTCTGTGAVRETCAVCAETRRTVLPAKGHAFTDETRGGSRVCAGCGGTECELLGHAYTGAVLAAPTCTQDGLLWKICARCGSPASEKLARTGHDWAPADCLTPETCRRCGETRGAPAGHDWASADCLTPETCRRCGETHGAPAGHDWASADCLAPETCRRCGETRGKPAGHDWAPAACETPETCRRCGGTRGSAAGHDWAPATMTEPETCRRCGKTRGQALARRVGTSEKGYAIVEKDGLTYVDGLLIVNKTYSLPAGYAPGDLTAECSRAFREMKSAAAAKGLNIYVSSGYRSYALQSSLYARYCASDGRAAADRYSARPGHSEHQTGLAMDLNTITNAFADTAEGRWVAANCWRWGFILRYPYGKEEQTGYMYEPWHLRYVGDKAEAIYRSGLCLEEYYGLTSVYA